MVKSIFLNVNLSLFQQPTTVSLLASQSHGTDGDQMISPFQVQDISTAPLPSTMHPNMAATPEDLLGLVEHVPPSPSIFLSLPSTPHDDSQQQDNLTLDYISRMLMEEDIDDKFFYMYPDHPMLLQAQQPFAQILSTSGSISSTPGMLASDLLPYHGSTSNNNTDIMGSASLPGRVQNPAFFLNGTGTVESNNSLFPDKGSFGMGMLSSIAFFKGMEEANRFLPRDNRLVQGSWHMNRFDVDGQRESNMGKSSNQMEVIVQPDSEAESTASEMFDRLLHNSYDMCSTKMNEVHITVERQNKAAQQNISRKAPHGRRGMRHTVVAADLETLLIRCAEAVATNDRRRAGDLLERIKWHSSPMGDAMQRLAHYFAEGLQVRLAGTGSQLYRSMIMEKDTSILEFLKGYRLYNSAYCYLKMSLLFSNKTIYNAIAGRKKLHIVHYGVSEGFQWPELLQCLAEREGGPPEVRITGISSPQPGFHPARRTEEAGRRLSYCARQFGVPFKFHAIIAKSEAVRVEDLDIDPDEVLVVNSLFHFRTLMDESLAAHRVNPRDLVLNTIKKMKPSLFVHAIVHGAHDSAFFVTRFRRTLSNFTAQFDMIETAMPRGSNKRLLVERDIFGQGAMNIIACEGADRVERPQNYKDWQARSQRAGLRQLPLDPDIVEMLKDKVKKQYHKHFMINEDCGWLLLGWKGRVLFALSVWSDDAGSNDLS